MKKFILYIILVVTCYSCKKDFLDVKPATFQNANSYFATIEQFTQAVNGAYSPLQTMYSSQMWVFAEMRSDNTSYQFNLSQDAIDKTQIDEFRETNDNTGVSSGGTAIGAQLFNTSYAGISRCNVILGKIENSGIDPSLLASISGQAHFLRAFYYYNLVKIFGDLPLVLTEIASTTDAFASASKKSSQEIYNSIISDATQAVNELPETYTAGQDIGRVTKAAARVLLAKVYMDQKQFDQALQQLREINNYSLMPDYGSIFSINNKNNAESIFEIQYTTNSPNEYSFFSYTFVPHNSGSFINGFPVLAGTGSGWNLPTNDLVDSYEANDLRKDISIGFDFLDPVTNAILPYVRKYLSPHTVRGQTGNNFPVYRYADVKLMIAECLNEAGFVANGEAFMHVNNIRDRAGLPPLGASVTNQDEFRNAVWHERRVELAFENHRWFDLLRYGNATQVMQAHGIQEKALKSHVLANSYTNINLVVPYPLREVLLTPP